MKVEFRETVSYPEHYGYANSLNFTAGSPDELLRSLYAFKEGVDEAIRRVEKYKAGER